MQTKQNNLNDIEPYPPSKGERYDFNTDEFTARFEYVAARTEVYFDNFRESIEYDFDMINIRITHAQSDLLLMQESFARGEVSVDLVKLEAVKLRSLFKRPAPVVDLRKLRELSNANSKPKIITPETFTPGDFYTQFARKVSGDRLKVWLKLNEDRLFFTGYPPPPGVVSASVEGSGGFDEHGEPVSQLVAEKIINLELTKEMQRLFGRSLYETIKEEGEGAKIPNIQDINAGGKDLDTVKAELEKTIQAKKDFDRAEKLKRASKKGK